MSDDVERGQCIVELRLPGPTDRVPSPAIHGQLNVHFDLTGDALSGRIYPATVVAERLAGVISEWFTEHWSELGMIGFQVGIVHLNPPREW